MVLSKRERYVALATIVAVGVLAFDHFALTPLLEARQERDTQLQSKTRQLRQNRAAIQLAQANKIRLQEMLRAGLRRHDAPEAESEVMKEIRNWAQQSNVTLTLLKADRLERERDAQDREKDFQKSTIRVTATGGMAEISHFLWYIQTADIPIAFDDLQLSTRKEGTDDLTALLTLSTIYLLPEGAEAPQQPASAPQTREVSE